MKKTNWFNFMQAVSGICCATPLKRLIFSIINLGVSILFSVFLYLSVKLYFANPWSNLILLSQILSIILSLICSIMLIVFAIYQFIVGFSSIKDFTENKLYSSLSLTLCIINVLTIFISVYFTLQLL